MPRVCTVCTHPERAQFGDRFATLDRNQANLGLREAATNFVACFLTAAVHHQDLVTNVALLLG